MWVQHGALVHGAGGEACHVAHGAWRRCMVHGADWGAGARGAESRGPQGALGKGKKGEKEGGVSSASCLYYNGSY